MGNHTPGATTLTLALRPSVRPSLRLGLLLGLALGLTLGLTLGLGACGHDPAPAPPPNPSPTTSAPTSPTTTTPTSPPTLPDAARQHTKAGAKAFVRYYVEAVDYAQQSLDTAPVEAVSAPTCVGCKAGIRTVKRIARKHGHVEGGIETVSALRSETVMANQSVTLTFDLVNEPQRVLIPGKKPLLHPAGTTKMLITLIPRDTGWITGELRGQ